MSDPSPRREQATLVVVSILLLLFCGVSATGAQELPLKRGLPGVDPFSCPEFGRPESPTEEEESQARVLGSNADQALILGDQARARDLLARATRLDPSSPDLAYRYARTLADLGEISEAVDVFCRALALGAEDEGILDARDRLEGLVQEQLPRIPEEALAQFSNGLTQADLGNPREAIQAFGIASRLAPEWADPVYNRAVIQDREGDVDGAVADYQAYLSLQPEGADAIAVSQRIGQLQSSGPPPSPGTALTLGMFLPGGGQFYSGRPLGGLTVLALAGGALAAGILIEEETVYCVGSVSSGGECPPDRFIREENDQPYLMYGLVAAGAVTFIGAVEAFLKVRGRGSGEDGELLSADVGGLEISGPAASAQGSRLHFDLLRIKFR